MVMIVTGAAGFIGSNLINALNQRGQSRILAVDNLEKPGKFLNLADCTLADYMDKREFIERIEHDDLDQDVEVVFHQGACSDTMEHDGRYMMENNFRYTRSLFYYCQDRGIPLIYASSAAVYGGNVEFRESPQCENPLNVYGYSKLAFDQFLRHYLVRGDLTAPCVGLRYFNVYGDREQHKGRMASVGYHFYHQYREHGRIRLFQGCDGYAHGEQRRDFISVEDVVRVNLWLLEHPEVSGIFNVGTGRSRTFNDMAVATINALRQESAHLSLEQMLTQNLIEYIPFPDALKGKYQSYTEADMSQLRAAGYTAPFLDVNEGVARYMTQLRARTPL
ncbi:MAG: ADP-glyceromanno-heptose 6-epimerase [Ferrovum sp.]|nr:ADP-glyceromanno-heptose 6-epimerase [Ferrovum sp.]NDU87211.1 ADP-glyceromanno-heptose 6-epimerase [Ferrovum sp.]